MRANVSLATDTDCNYSSTSEIILFDQLFRIATFSQLVCFCMKKSNFNCLLIYWKKIDEIQA